MENLGSAVPDLDFSASSKAANAFVLLNTGLGNRTARPGRGRDKECVLCGGTLDEVHLLFVCSALEPVRERVGIRGFQQKRTTLDPWALYSSFWNVWDVSLEAKNVRVKAAMNMRRAYLRVLGTR